MLGVQTFSVCCLFLWGLIITYPILWFVNKLIPIRLDPVDEIKGCDIVEHYMGDENEKMLAPLDNIQISNMKFNGPQVNFNIPPNSYNDTYKEFDTLGKRKPFHVNQGYERDESAAQQHTTDRL